MAGKGDLQTIGRKRREPARDAVHRRVARFKDKPPTVQGVQPLNPGFFHLERLRAHVAAKKHGSKRVKLR